MLFLIPLLLSFGVVAKGNPLSSHNAKLGAVASESAVCSNVGIDMLKDGGNAADAVSSP